MTTRESFDTVRDLAHFLPFAVVTELVGLDQEVRAKVLDWAAGQCDHNATMVFTA